MYISLTNTIGALKQRVTSSPFIGILNTYSGASVAYSLRQLDSAYTSSAIKVRRSSDNTEQDIGFANNILDTSSLLAFVGSGDGFVSIWYDQSGNANNAINGSAANQPKIVSSGEVELENGLPTLNYDGVDDQLSLTTTNLGSTFFVSLVYRSNRTSSEDYVLVGDGLATRIRLYATQIKSYISNAIYTFTAATGFGVQYMYQLESNDSLEFITYRNSVALGASQSIPTADNFIIDYIGYGSSRPTNGHMQEVIAYSTEQNANRIGMATNINDYYSIY